jgi:hypothetical protein
MGNSDSHVSSSTSKPNKLDIELWNFPSQWPVKGPERCVLADRGKVLVYDQTSVRSIYFATNMSRWSPPLLKSFFVRINRRGCRCSSLRQHRRNSIYWVFVHDQWRCSWLESACLTRSDTVRLLHTVNQSALIVHERIMRQTQHTLGNFAYS